MPKTRLILLLSILVPAAPLSAQDDAYLDPTARELVARSRETRDREGSEIISYEAVVMQRTAVRLRMPMRDRMLMREESAMRVRWTRDGATLVQMLAGRDENMGQGAHVPGPELSALFDPDADRLDVGIDLGLGMSSGEIDADVDSADGTSDFSVTHPLAEGSEAFYRYRSGDTLSMRLPGGRTIRLVELSAIPRTETFRHLRASLWLEPESGVLVRAIFRPAGELDIMRDTAFLDADDADALKFMPGMLRPIFLDIELVTIEYSLWDQRHWLPYRTSIEGHVRAGTFRVPFERETSVRIEEVNDESTGVPRTVEEVLAAWNDAGVDLALDSIVNDGQLVLALVPRDSTLLLNSDHLPPPVWQDAPEFASSAEMEELGRRLVDQIPGVSIAGRSEFGLHHPLHGRGLVRFNRVEALSLGVRGVVEHAHGRVSATVRLGAADLHPNVELGALVPRRSFTVRTEAYHRLATVDPGMPAFEAPPPALGFGNSLGALLAGRDDGWYYRVSGATLALEPLPEERLSWRTAFFVERQDEVRRKVEWNLAAWFDADRRLRPNIVAEDGLFAGASLLLAPWWGMAGPQAGLELFAEGVTPEMEIDSTFARARLTGRTILSVTRKTRLGAEAAVGHSWGGPPIQYAWFLGGATSVRGYDGGARVGASMTRARLELTHGIDAASIAFFADAGWAGRRQHFDRDDALLGGGIGFTLLGGLLRLDVARAFTSPTGWRVHFHLDALL